MKVAVIGARGRMGSSIVQAVEAAADLELVAGLDAGEEITSASLRGAEVAVEFTVPGATDKNVHALLDAGVNVVVGTTGWTPERLERVRAHAEEVQKCVLIAPNYSLSAVFAMRFAREAAAYFESVEVIELHHPDKVDAPSGTALTTAQGIAQARAQAEVPPSPDATEIDNYGARGANIEGVHVHAIRLRGLYAHEEILYGNPGEQLVIRQDSFARESFMPGILLGIRKVGDHLGLTYGLDKFLDI
ncbi:4-hydroxy-tetrahydrodipicolinate reductase [Arcanobacterium urinimassiliense]|uniref:4-hydroxy-tetrahydrodipicolinate reductase n=1 Tax=Arcanobacterium urinimassiliense TaxID=1871014 RepID=UPI00093EE098|nr:4-hydroxy-tetrahydrodipicolinate reductase [Arcanobacterium urinimassiliense]MBS6274837.1 4-hydroxy-tetrahydrodipicolinate reductase [Actinomycetaceae bacterium]